MLLKQIQTLIILALILSTQTTLFAKKNLLGPHLIIAVQDYPLSKQTIELINNYNLSGILFLSQTYSHANTVSKAIETLKQNRAPHKSPLLFCIDQEGGKVNRIKKGVSIAPSAQSIAKSKNTWKAKQIAFNTAKELSKLGININFAPVVDSLRNPENSVIGSRSFGSNPNSITKHATIVINEHLKQNIIPVIKHFPGHGQTKRDSHYTLPIHSNKNELEAYDIHPFYRLIKTESPAIMISHVLYPSLDNKHPASLSPHIVSSLLKEDMGYKGLIISDDLAMGAIANSKSLLNASTQALKAGVDQLIISCSTKECIQLLNSFNSEHSQNKAFAKTLEKRQSKILDWKQKWIQ